MQIRMLTNKEWRFGLMLIQGWTYPARVHRGRVQVDIDSGNWVSLNKREFELVHENVDLTDTQMLDWMDKDANEHVQAIRWVCDNYGHTTVRQMIKHAMKLDRSHNERMEPASNRR